MLDVLGYLHYGCIYEDEPVELSPNSLKAGVGISLALLTCTASPSISKALSGLRLNDTGPDVVNLKQRLQSKECLPPRLSQSDEYDRYTSAAVKNLQRQHGLPMTDSVIGPTADLIETDASCQASKDTGALKLKDQGRDVEMLRIQLKNWGFPLAGQELLAVTSAFDQDTEAALKEFEKFFELKEDGMLDVLDSEILWTARDVELSRFFADIIETDSNATARLIPFLKSSNFIDRREAIKAFGNMGSDAENALPDLIALLNSEDANVLIVLADAIGQIGGAEAVPDLIALLKSRNVKTRTAAADALGNLGTNAKSAVPELAKLLDDNAEHPMVGYQFVSDSAMESLARIGPAAEEAIPALEKQLEEPSTERIEDPQIKELVIDYKSLGAAMTLLAVDPSLSVLLDGLRSTDDRVQESSIYALSYVRPINQKAVDELQQIVNTPNEEMIVRLKAAIALTLIGKGMEKFYNENNDQKVKRYEIEDGSRKEVEQTVSKIRKELETCKLHELEEPKQPDRYFNIQTLQCDTYAGGGGGKSWFEGWPPWK